MSDRPDLYPHLEKLSPDEKAMLDDALARVFNNNNRAVLKKLGDTLVIQHRDLVRPEDFSFTTNGQD